VIDHHARGDVISRADLESTIFSESGKEEALMSSTFYDRYSRNAGSGPRRPPPGSAAPTSKSKRKNTGALNKKIRFEPAVKSHKSNQGDSSSAATRP
jgi:hypothetical protein